MNSGIRTYECSNFDFTLVLVTLIDTPAFPSNIFKSYDVYVCVTFWSLVYTSYVVDFSRVLALMQWTSGVHPRGEEEEGRSKYWPSIRESKGHAWSIR